MGLISRIAAAFRGGNEEKAVQFSPEFAAAINAGWGIPTKSGQAVNSLNALQITAYYRAGLVIAEGVAQLPIEIYRRLPSGRGVEQAVDHPLYDILAHRPSGLQDAFQFWRTTLLHAALAGNGVSYRVMVRGQLRELIPIRPDSLAIDIKSTTMQREYRLGFETGDIAVVGQSEVLHIAGPSWGMTKAEDPATVGREAIGLAKATEESHASFHKNGARPSGVLQQSSDSGVKLTAEQIERLRQQWSRYQGSSSAGETVILPGGLTWEQVTMKGVDAEHLDTRKHQIEEIARLLGVFPIMLGHAGDQSPTFASAEAFMEAHVRYTLQPWIKATKSAIETQLLTREERADGYHVRIDTSELLRGSLKDRTEYYGKALGTNSSPGWLTPNEVREDDGWNPADDADMEKVWQPATMSPDRQAGPQDQSAPAPTPAEQKSSAPRTLFMRRKVLNGSAILKWASDQGIPNLMSASDLHVTVVYSKVAFDWMAAGEAIFGQTDGNMNIAPGGPRVVEPIGDQGAVALLFTSYALASRHRDLIEAGASTDYPDFQPHITLTWDAAGMDPAKIDPYRGAIVLGPEIFSEIDPSWTPRKA